MKEWTLHISYKLKSFKINAVLEYHSDQIMRIRVHGSTSTILLENDYPAKSKTKSTRGLKWKIKEGAMKKGSTETSGLTIQIMSQLEDLIKKDFPPNPYLF